MKMEAISNISRMPKNIALDNLPYIVAKILNGAEVTLNYENKKDVACILFDGESNIMHFEDFLVCKTIAAEIYKEFVEANRIESSYQTLSNTFKILCKARSRIERIYDNKTAGKRKIIAIKGDDSGCGYWRMVLPVRALDYKEYCVDVSTVEVVYEYLLEYDVIFVQRVSTWSAYYVIEKLKKLGKTIIYDIDDNLFDVPDFHPAKRKFGNDMREAASAIMLLSDKIVVTTSNLKNVLVCNISDTLKDKIEIIPNSIDLKNFERKNKYPEKMEEPFRIFWSGSATHEYDFMMCIDALDKFLLNHKNDKISLLFMGYLPMCIREKAGKEHWKNRVEFVEFKDIETYFKMLRQVDADIGIAPLVDCKFNEAKSNIKWQEYTMAGMPVLASDVGPYKETIIHGQTGFLASNEQEWLMILEDKFKNRQASSWGMIVDNARKEIDENYNIDKNAKMWKSVFSNN